MGWFGDKLQRQTLSKPEESSAISSRNGPHSLQQLLCWACKSCDQPLPCYLRASLETIQTLFAWFLCSPSSPGQLCASGPSLGPVMRARSSHSSLPQPYQLGHTEPYSQPAPPGLQSGPSPPPLSPSWCFANTDCGHCGKQGFLIPQS